MRPPRRIGIWAGGGGAVRAVKLLLVAVAGFFILAAAYTSSLIVERQDALRKVSRYNVAWLASQAVVELAKLQQRIAAHQVPGSNVGQDEVQLRLDILANRVGLLRGGEVAELVAGNRELCAIIDELAAAVEAAQPLVATDDPAALRTLQDLLSPLEPKLARLAAAANVHGGDQVAEDQRHLSRLHWIFSGILLALACCGLGLFGLLLWHNRLLQRTHGELLARTGELHTQNERFDAALNNMSQALCMVDADQRLIVCNRQYMELFGLSPAQVRPRTPMQDILAAIVSAGHYPRELAEVIHEEQQALIRDRLPANFFREQSGGRALAVSHQPMPGGGWVATYEDITERRRAEARIAYMAHHDALTGLPNRLLFRERMEQELGRLDRQGGWLAVLCLDIDHFKNVNDTLGHPAGDKLLQAVAQRLRACVREPDTVARLSGDEFAILLTASGQPASVQALADRLLKAISAPYDIEGHRVVATASIGAALAPGDGDNADELLKNADMALYRAKADGRAAFRFFETEMHARLQTRLALEMDLREAVEKGQLEVFYQPLLDLKHGRIGGFEALLRWRHPERGLVSPDQFIPLAEETGLILPIGEWVLRRACTDAMGWPEHVKVAVNLSARQFRSPDLVQAVSAALAETGLPAGRLELEVTESVLLQDDEMILALLHRLRGLGLRISLDDFGTGYSSLTHLQRLPLDEIKVHRSFVAPLEEADGPARVVLRSIVGIAHGLGLVTTAEGVESEQVARSVAELGCERLQGYLIAAPMGAEEALAWLQRWAPGVTRAAA